jgi:hypothetical protein
MFFTPLRTGRFHDVFRGCGTFSKTFIWAFLEVFTNAIFEKSRFPESYAVFRARLFPEFFSRLATFPVSCPSEKWDRFPNLSLRTVGWASPTIGSHQPGRGPRNTQNTRKGAKDAQTNATQVKTKGRLRPLKSSTRAQFATRNTKSTENSRLA